MKSILGILLILASIGGGVFYIKPQLASVNAKRAELSTYNSALKKAEELREARDKLLETYNNLDASKVERVKRMVPEGIDNVKLAIEIDSLASRMGLGLKGIDIKDPSGGSSVLKRAPVSITNTDPQSPYGTATITFTVVGSYAKFNEFLANLETSLRLIDVKGISFTAPRSTIAKDKDLFEFQVTVDTYWLRNEALTSNASSMSPAE
jgi:Tfp pilus assembly protein PilO